MRFRDVFIAYGLALLIAAAGFALAYRFVEPAPPGTIRMAAGPVGGAYHALAERYAALLASSGIDLEVITTAGSVDNLHRLETGTADLAFVQGGLTSPSKAELYALGSLYYEPVWLFYRRGANLNTLGDLRGARIDIGVEGSGTRPLALELLMLNGIDAASAVLSGRSPKEAAAALLAGEVDAIFMVASPKAEPVAQLIRAGDIEIFDCRRGQAYGRLRRYLSTLELPRGVLDLAADRPATPITLLSVTANLVVRRDLHPALIDLMLKSAREIHGEGGLFEQPGEFPSARYVALPLSPDAERYYENGPSFLQRYLPFWAATLADRMKVMLLPLIGLLIPILRVMPSLYRWRTRSRIYRWYSELRNLDPKFRRPEGAVDVSDALNRLEQMEGEVTHITVPLSYADELYNLRVHIDLVRVRLRDHGGDARRHRPSIAE